MEIQRETEENDERNKKLNSRIPCVIFFRSKIFIQEENINTTMHY